MSRRDVGFQFLRVSFEGEDSWVVFVDGQGDTWTYLANDGRFHFNQAVYADLHFDHENQYRVLTVEEAQQVCRTAERFDADDNTLPMTLRERSLSVDQVLRLHRGESTQETPEPGAPSPWEEEVERRVVPPSGPPETPDSAPPLPGVELDRKRDV